MTLRAASSGQRADALVRRAVEHHVFVDLVGDHQHVGRPQQLGQLLHVVGASRRCALGLCGELMMIARVRGSSAAAMRSKSGRKLPARQRHMDRRCAGQHDVRLVAVVAGVEHDHFVARMDQREDRGQDRLRRAGGDRDLAGRVVAAAVQRLDLGRHRLAQRRRRRPSADTGCGRSRIAAVDRVEQRRVAVEIGKALAEVDRIVLLRERRHHGEDRRADVRQAAGDGRGGVSRSWTERAQSRGAAQS